jgi:phage major head subunit gpT-like protein
MIINDANLQALRTGFNTSFQTGLGMAADVSGPLATPVTSTTLTETYGWMEDLPEMKEWVGEKQFESLREKSYTLKNRPFESSIKIHKHKIADDNLGLYAPIMQGYGQTAGELMPTLLFEALSEGHERECFDGQNFFDADHVLADQTFSNIDTSDDVEPWYVVCLSRPIKPLLAQWRERPSFVSNVLANGANDHLFDTGEYKFGVEARAAAGYTFWQLAFRSTAAPDATSIQAAMDFFGTITNTRGKRVGLKATHIVTGTSNRAAIDNVLAKPNLAGGESNTLNGKLQIIEAPLLA